LLSLLDLLCHKHIWDAAEGMQVLRPIRQAQGRLSLRFAQDDKYGAGKAGFFASVEMTIPFGVEARRVRCRSMVLSGYGDAANAVFQSPPTAQ
jgi:hypothetical protein